MFARGVELLCSIVERIVIGSEGQKIKPSFILQPRLPMDTYDILVQFTRNGRDERFGVEHNCFELKLCMEGRELNVITIYVVL